VTLPELLVRRQEAAAKLAELDAQILAVATQPAPAHEPDSLITLDALAERLGIKTSYAYALARRDAFPVVKVGKLIRVREAVVREIETGKRRL
jgi:excisionase family DNA binding protein